MNLREAAQQALTALEHHAMQRTYAGGFYISNAAIALRSALAQPVPDAKPVACPMCAERQQQRADDAQWHADIAKGRRIVAEHVAAQKEPQP